MMTLGFSTLNVWHLCYRIIWAVVLMHMKRKLFAALFEIVQSSVQVSSVAQSCLTLCDSMNRSTPGLPVHHQLLEFTQTHIHWVSDAIQPSTTAYGFCFGSIPSFFLESPVAYWAPTDLGSSSFSILSVCLFILFMGFSRKEYWSGLPFPSPVDHILSDLSTMPTRLVWPHRHGLILLSSTRLWS